MSNPWMDIAHSLKGVSEIAGSNDNPRIVEMFRLCGHGAVKDDETAWCAAFVGACLKLSGYEGTSSLMARSYEKFGKKLTKPVEGCLVVFWRNSKKSGSGHVGFYEGETTKTIRVFGGNQGNQVNVKSYSRSQFLGYFMPVKTSALPTNSILPTILDVNAENAPPHLGGTATIKKDVSMPSSNVQLTAQFLTIHPTIEKWEGGYVDHPSDPGGATNMGITQKTLSGWRGRSVSKAEVRSLSNFEARQIFKTRYYDKVCGDLLPAPVALATYNSSVLSGVSRASSWLQRVVNSMGGQLDVDGEIGPLTLTAVRQLDAHAVAAGYFNQYEQFLRGLKHWKTFGRGWMNRVNDMRGIATGLQGDAPPIIDHHLPVPVPHGSPAPSADVIAVVSLLLKAIGKTKQRGGDDDFGELMKVLLKGKKPVAEKDDALTPVNNAFGETIGKLLNGRKTGLGILGLLATKLLPVISPQLAAALAMTSTGGGTIWSSLLSGLLAWGVLGKTDKWVKGK